MVIFCEWPRAAVDQKSSSGLPMTGEDTGLGSLASPLAGYLGKVQERVFSLENCPWCASKGLNYALRSYCINLQESITLCTNPECLFPLVSRSLEEVLDSLNHVESTGNKRKKSLALEKEDLLKPSPKRLRSDELDSFDSTNFEAPHCAVQTVSNTCLSDVDAEKANGQLLNVVCLGATTEVESSQDGDAAEPDSRACTEDFPPPAHSAFAERLQSSSEGLPNADLDQLMFSSCCGALSTLETDNESRQVKSHPEVLNRPSNLTSNESGKTVWTESLPADYTIFKDTSSSELEMKDLSCNLLTQSEELVSVPNQLFWWNSNNLCWLDSLLVALVNCKNLRKSKPKDEPQQSSVWQLMRGYENIHASIQASQHTDRDGIPKVLSHVLQKANADLHNLRMTVFKLLEPRLRCTLGQMDTPVFAMPLLLMMDSWVEPLFQSTFHWELKCSECNTATNERVMKTLPSFTNLVPEWRPLHAVHLAPCNTCSKKNERRTMILEKVPPVFVLHFVEGLPDNDVTLYTFSFNGKRYSVTTVIQYNQQLKHFITWVSNSDGSWLEYDDLKHPYCKTHQKLPVPAQEMHVVFWEVEEDEEPHACSPSTTCANSPPYNHQIRPSLCEKDEVGDNLLTCSPDQSLVSHNVSDSDVLCALTNSDNNNSSSSIMDATVTDVVDVSIGSTTLLDTFEGLSHNDIITLTLDLVPDTEIQCLNESDVTQDPIIPNTGEIPSMPDTSSAVIGQEISQGAHVESATTSVDELSSDPASVPRAKRGRGRGRGVAKGKAVGVPKDKKAALSKTLPHVSPAASSEPSSVSGSKPSDDAATHGSTALIETTKPASPVSSTEAVPLSTSHVSPTKAKTLDQNPLWSFLLSKRPMNQFHKSTPGPTRTTTSATQVKPAASNLVHTLPTPGKTFPKPKLAMEESMAVPLKAAETYVAFSTKSSNTQSFLPSAAPATQPITPHHQKPLESTALTLDSPLAAPVRTSKVPPGLSTTEAVRYKLMKKLKAKKKLLAKLNKILPHVGETGLQPDSTNLSPPITVTSSTYDGSSCDDFLLDLLSPATTKSSLSPDSTGLQEILNGGQASLEQSHCGVGAAVAASHADTFVIENFLDEFCMQPEMDNAFDMFM